MNHRLFPLQQSAIDIPRSTPPVTLTRQQPQIAELRFPILQVNQPPSSSTSKTSSPFAPSTKHLHNALHRSERMWIEDEDVPPHSSRRLAPQPITSALRNLNLKASPSVEPKISQVHTFVCCRGA